MIIGICLLLNLSLKMNYNNICKNFTIHIMNIYKYLNIKKNRNMFEIQAFGIYICLDLGPK